MTARPAPHRGGREPSPSVPRSPGRREIGPVFGKCAATVESRDQLVGALMHGSAAHAAPILELVPDSAIWRPDNRWAVEIIRFLVADGCDPDPVLVLRTPAIGRPPTPCTPTSPCVPAGSSPP